MSQRSSTLRFRQLAQRCLRLETCYCNLFYHKTTSYISFYFIKKKKVGGAVAQLVEHRTGTPPTQVRFPGAARDFSPRVNFQCRLSYGVRTPPVCNRVHSHLCARSRSRSPCKSSFDYGNTKTPNKHRRLGSATRSQLAFPVQGNPNYSFIGPDSNH